MSSFRCLAIETATNLSSIAACNGADTAQIQLQDSRTSSRQLYQSVRSVLTQVGLRPTELDCIAFGCGPGSFTGVRVAAGAAQALAYSLNVPVCRISTLRALAAAGRLQSAVANVAVCLDARMGEVYAGSYSGAALQVCRADELVQPDNYLLKQIDGGWLAVGNGWQEFPAMLATNQANIVACLTDIWPDAEALLSIARTEFAAGVTSAPAGALPNYLRDQVTQ